MVLLMPIFGPKHLFDGAPSREPLCQIFRGGEQPVGIVPEITEALVAGSTQEAANRPRRVVVVNSHLLGLSLERPRVGCPADRADAALLFRKQSIDTNVLLRYYLSVIDEYLTVQDAAAALGISEVSVRSALNRSRLPFVEKYGRKLIARAALDAYRQRTQPDGVKRVGRPRKGGENHE